MPHGVCHQEHDHKYVTSTDTAVVVNNRTRDTLYSEPRNRRSFCPVEKTFTVPLLKVDLPDCGFCLSGDVDSDLYKNVHYVLA